MTLEIASRMSDLMRDLRRVKTRFPFNDLTVMGEAILDEDFYHWRYNDLQGVDALRHLLLRGQKELRSPNCLFEARYYVEQHSSDCSSALQGELDDSPVSHFLNCETFSCPTPLLNLGSGPDKERRLRGLYLAIVGGLVNPDSYATSFFDAGSYGFNKTFHLPYKKRSSDTAGLSQCSSLVHYATFASRPESLGESRDPNPLFDNLLVNHLATDGGNGASLSVTPLSWYIAERSRPTRRRLPIRTNSQCSIESILQLLTSKRESFSSEEKLVEVLSQQSTHETSGALPEPTLPAKVSVLSIHLDSDLLSTLSLGLLKLNSSIRKSLEVIVLDNASEDGSWMRFQRDASHLADQLVRKDTRVSFGEANNIMAELSTGKFLLLLNSDAMILPETVMDLAAYLDSNLSVAAVAPTLLFEDGRVQEAGGWWFEDGSVNQYGKGCLDLSSLPTVYVESRVSNVYRSAACLMIRRESFFNVGGFSPVYDPAYYEDTDLCAKLSQLGSIASLSSAKCVHLENATNQRVDLIPDRSALIEINRMKFSARVPSIRNEVSDGLGNLSQRQDFQVRENPRFLVTSPYALNVGGGEKYILELARLLSCFGTVSLAFPAEYSQLRLQALCGELGVPQFSAALTSIDKAKKLLPSLHVAMGNSAIPPIDGLGNQSIYHCQFPFRQLDPPGELDFEVLKKYRAAIVNSEFTKMNLTSGQPHWRDKCFVVHPPVTLSEDLLLSGGSRPSDIQSQLGIVSVGRFFAEGHRKNQHLLVEALELLISRGENVQLTLIGSVSADRQSLEYLRLVRRASFGLPVKFLINPSRSMLAAELLKNRVYWHATGLEVSPSSPEGMEHFGISVVEACQAGLYPFVHRSGGPAEVLSEVLSTCSYESIDELVLKTQIFLRHSVPSNFIKSISDIGQKYTREHFNRQLTRVFQLE